MVCPSPANFDTCEPKCRCPVGSCTGIAFSCGSPCSPGMTWDPSTCSCLTGAGTYKIQVDTANQANPTADGTLCYVSYFPEPSFNALGQFVERRWFFSRREWPNDGAFALISPDGPMAGLPLSAGGPPSPWLPLGDVSVSQAVLSEDYCDRGGDSAGHGNGLAAFGLVVDDSYILNVSAVPGGFNIAGCDRGGSSVISTSVSYLGPGRPEDYYELNEMAGTSSYRVIISAETGQPSCQGPSKTP